MRGESDRECRAGGGALKKQASKNVLREARGAHPKNTPDATLSRGSGIFRKGGGKVEGFEDGGAVDRADGGSVDYADGGAIDRADGGLIARLKGGRVKKAFGGSTISGGGKKPSMGRAGRARGGGVGADLKPQTHHGGTGPKGRKLMADSERQPPRN